MGFFLILRISDPSSVNTKDLDKLTCEHSPGSGLERKEHPIAVEPPHLFHSMHALQFQS